MSALENIEDAEDRAQAQATIARLTQERDEVVEAARVYIAERDHERARVARAVTLLTGIHSLLSPALVEANGKTYIFHSPHIHEQLQALSDKVRALPDEIDALGAAATAREEALRALAEHLRHCRECGETDISSCYEGWPMWVAAIDAARKGSTI